MTHRFLSTVDDPAERGEEFGSRHAAEVARTIDGYWRVFQAGPPLDLDGLGRAALERIVAFSPALAQEIRGIAYGAGLPVYQVAAINARTEILAMSNQELCAPPPDECSAVVSLGAGAAEPAAMQTWDWYTDMADNWFEWVIPLPGGRRVVTVTEYGIVGKIGVNANGVGLLFTMLHHRDDGAGMGVPVHAIARTVLDTATTVDAGLAVVATARTSASTSLTLVGARRSGRAAATAELWPGGPGQVRPTPEGLLVHTNHFLSDPARRGDLTPMLMSTTVRRYEALRRRLEPYRGRASSEQILAAMNDHDGGVCCHADPAVDPLPYRATLATISLDLAVGDLSTHAGGPCTLVPQGHRRPVADPV